MQVGSLVEAVGNFDDVKKHWGDMVKFPNKGDILTIKSVITHPHESMRKIGAVLLTFEELNNDLGISDKTYKNEPNFIELQQPIEVNIDEIVKEIEEPCTI